VAICLSLASGAQATTIGSQAFVDINSPTANGSPTGNLNTSTIFTIAQFVSTTSQTGIFAGMPRQFFSPFTFDITNPASLTFGNSVFGTFASTAITVVTNIAGFLNISALGVWTPGTFGGVTGGPFLSTLTFTFTQDPAHSGAIGASATFATTSTVIPEPPSIVMGLTGLAAGVGIYLLRQRRRAAIAMV
jgi:hypothetical protein